jgi:hypothetical protein
MTRGQLAVLIVAAVATAAVSPASANDTRTEAQKWLNDPAPGRSALAQHSQGSNGAGNFPAPTQRSAGTRVDLWKFR